MVKIMFEKGKLTFEREKSEKFDPLLYYPKHKRFATEVLVDTLLFFIFIPMLLALFFIIYAFFAGYFGNVPAFQAFGLFLFVVVLILRVGFVLDSAYDSTKEWPKCPKDGSRLRVESRTEKDGKVYSKMACPHGDYRITVWWTLVSRRWRYGSRFRASGFRGGGFGGGRFGGGGMGR